ncbi:UTRA domain-containing protein [Ramlibacter sp. MAH-25]|uniref:UTRA domain-containing protein n=1 Tax=Ramlibacter pinisoli TaxID=2682844 RepID=A0A6N8IU05_9BURK|nr:UTRA domain-containing protein [Ramlibacter pinisoli]
MPLPKYHRVYLLLRQQLQDGEFADGLPGEMALVKQYGVARVTVRRALGQLAAEGLISRHPGRSTRPTGVAPSERPAAEAPARTQLTGLLENLVSMGLRTSVRVLEAVTLPAPAPVAEALRIEAGGRVQRAVRVRSTREGPLSRITTWVPLAVAPAFTRKDLARKPILLLLERAGVAVGRAEQTISATLADAQVAADLDVPVGSALLAVRRLIYDDRERPVQWLHGLYRPDRYEYEMQLSRVGGIDAKVWVSRELAAQFH